MVLQLLGTGIVVAAGIQLRGQQDETRRAMHVLVPRHQQAPLANPVHTTQAIGQQVEGLAVNASPGSNRAWY